MVSMLKLRQWLLAGAFLCLALVASVNAFRASQMRREVVELTLQNANLIADTASLIRINDSLVQRDLRQEVLRRNAVDRANRWESIAAELKAVLSFSGEGIDTAVVLTDSSGFFDEEEVDEDSPYDNFPRIAVFQLDSGGMHIRDSVVLYQPTQKGFSHMTWRVDPIVVTSRIGCSPFANGVNRATVRLTVPTWLTVDSIIGTTDPEVCNARILQTSRPRARWYAAPLTGGIVGTIGGALTRNASFSSVLSGTAVGMGMGTIVHFLTR